MTEWLPHLNGALNAIVTILVVLGVRAIRRGDRALHPRLMGSGIAVGAVFVCTYVLQVSLTGHGRFPGDDWVRALFLWILGTHTVLAVVVVPMILRAVVLARSGRLDAHKTLVRWAAPIWIYVAATGVLIYVMNNWVRPN